jgi:hypothetical protein
LIQKYPVLLVPPNGVADEGRRRCRPLDWRQLGGVNTLTILFPVVGRDTSLLTTHPSMMMEYLLSNKI